MSGNNQKNKILSEAWDIFTVSIKDTLSVV